MLLTIAMQVFNNTKSHWPKSCQHITNFEKLQVSTAYAGGKGNLEFTLLECRGRAFEQRKSGVCKTKHLLLSVSTICEWSTC